jgi:type IV secretory pathway TrbL component
MKKSLAIILFFTALLLLPVPASARGSREENPDKGSLWKSAGDQIDNAFFFVVDKVVDLQGYFIFYSKGVGRVVFLIAILSAGLNHALTGTGLKENLIKIFKATVFFLIVISFYPRIIGWITENTFNMAYGSTGKFVEDYFKNATREIEVIEFNNGVPMDENGFFTGSGSVKEAGFETTYQQVKLDSENLFSDLSVKRKHPRIGEYTVVAPANLLKILFFMAGDFIKFADKKQTIVPDITQSLKGLFCAGFTIATGCFALLEYLVCFLEFMLVTSVGVILFPLSIWEGSKFMSEKFIGAVVGFFMKMLFCNIAIFLLLYGFISLYYSYSGSGGFQGKADQIIFIVFSCLLFFYICKSAPGIAQSLLTGTPSLSASGAISAATGAVAAAGATMGMAKKVGGAVGGTVVGGAAKGVFGFAGSMKEANAAQTSAMEAVAQAGGSTDMIKQAGNNAFRSSLANDVGDSFKSGALGLTRSLLSGGKGGPSGSAGGGGTNPHSWRADFLNNLNEAKDGNQSIGEHMGKRGFEGGLRGKASAEKDLARWEKMGFQRQQPAPPSPDKPASSSERPAASPPPNNVTGSESPVSNNVHAAVNGA